MTFDDLWPTLAIPGEFDAMDGCDQGRWRGVLQQAFDAAIAAERERCATLCEAVAERHFGSGRYRSVVADHSVRAGGQADGAEECARAIRDAYHEIKGRPAFKFGPYLGPTYTAPELTLPRLGGLREAVKLLVENKIVSHFESRSEMGPRALGHRSILMSPLVAENKNRLNSRVKHREEFRPFAPAVPLGREREYFDLDRPSPYMLLVPEVRQDKRSVIPAVTHVDGTARVQTVTPECGMFASLIEEFGHQTGVPVLLNTSFNVAGEPIVETPEDAVRCFLGTDIDALLLDGVLYGKDRKLSLVAA